MDGIEPLTRQQLAHLCAELEEKHDTKKQEATDAWKAYQSACSRLIQAMEAEGMTKFIDTDLHKDFKIDIGMSFKVREGEMDAFYDWLESSGNSDCIKRTIHSSTRDAIIRQHMEKTGQDVPGIDATPYKKIAMRTVKTKGVINE